ncbi:hypothetical protein [Actinoplanes sp. DH11]|uniref:hypothetical protein n=1 Tax=Actinoplanes sp. DH11 TaxID=2857011 RepID=UPI001E285E7F|nr:hypothetical protein [Actinoplanes sp. DH11]
MSDKIEQLFADLRAETLTTVVPPGTGPLRRAARRRRTVLPVTAAAAVLAVTGLSLVVRPGDSPAPPAAPVGAGPGHDSRTLEEEVSRKLGLDPALRTLGNVAVSTANGPQEERRTLPGGSYDVRLACFGTGSMHVTVTAGRPPATSPASVPCDDADRSTVITVPITVPGGGAVTVRVVPEVSGPGRAGFGYAIEMAQADRLRLQLRARDALAGTPRHAFLAMEGGMAYEDPGDADRRRIRAVCVGLGTATLRVGAAGGEAVSEAPIRCATDNPPVTTLDYDRAGPLIAGVVPDAETIGRAAGALTVEPS